MSIFIGALAYANGSLHLGHIASLLPGDILARYYRSKGENVLYVSGSDCNGTPIAIRAKQEGVTAKEIADKYHEELSDVFVTLVLRMIAIHVQIVSTIMKRFKMFFTFIRRRTYL